MSSDFEIRLLTATKDKRRVLIKEVSDSIRMNPGILRDRLAVLNENNLLTLSDEALEMSSAQRMLLAYRLIRKGDDPERVSRAFSWQEFESFAGHMLEENEYHASGHLVFKSSKGRREIDLVAWNDSVVLAVDCKHWARRLSPSRVRSAVSAQIERAQLLAERTELLTKCGMRMSKSRDVLPVIVTLVESQEKVVVGVPVVPILKLPSFLNGLSPIDESLRMIPIRPSSQTTLV